ncbi:hypothetical protein L9F63_012605, partial [Diploptera punctata]
LLWLYLCFVIYVSAGVPTIRDNLPHPVHVYEGDDALITCVVRDVGKNTVMWKKEDSERHSRRVLTAGESRVTADKRFDVLHDAVCAVLYGMSVTGGDVWVLVIKDAKPADSGIYVCEVNSIPVLRSFHKLSVLSRALLPPDNMTDPMLFDNPKTSLSKNHNYTDCCINSNVSSLCFGFCNIQSILEGNTGQDPENCEADFPDIVRCMADGRNHVPCCIQEGVPDICQDVSYTEQTLACIVEGIEILPSPPENVEVEAMTEKSIKVSWSRPSQNTESISEFVVNVTMLKTFDEDLEFPEDDSYAAAADSYALAAAGLSTSSMKPPSTVPSVIESTTVEIKVPGTYNNTIVNDLKPYTMYEISVKALNIHGSSLPSYSIRTLTLTNGKMKPTNVAQPPALPDIKQCCVNKGISHSTCVDKLCDPALSDIAEVTDLMICAPWAADTFSCLTNGMDHTSCCKARGLPDLCQELCNGTITQIDFSYFKCLKYMSDYTNCLLQGYGVLPSAPTKLHVSNIEVEFAIIHWDAPKTLGDTVLYYNVHYRMMATYNNEYRTISKVHSPFILEHLYSNMDYEVFVEAVNSHGVGQPSARVIFRTESKKIEEASFYNVTACCIETDLIDVCLPLCSYNANMSDIKALAGVCGAELHKLLKCGAGGRNHGSCCTRRGVPTTCLSVCSGVIVDSLIATATSCIPFIGNIVQCFEEGTGLLPGPIAELHATAVTNTSITLQWEPPTNGTNVTDYVVHYQQVDNTSMHETLPKLDHKLKNDHINIRKFSKKRGGRSSTW